MIKLFEKTRGETKFTQDWVYICMLSMTGCSLTVNLYFPEEDVSKPLEASVKGDPKKQAKP